jgi:hypothetical protein
MLSKKCRQVSARITYIAIPVAIAVALAFSVPPSLSDIEQGKGTWSRIVAVVIFGNTWSDTTRYILSTRSFLTNKRSLENAKREAER